MSKEVGISKYTNKLAILPCTEVSYLSNIDYAIYPTAELMNSNYKAKNRTSHYQASRKLLFGDEVECEKYLEEVKSRFAKNSKQDLAPFGPKYVTVDSVKYLVAEYLLELKGLNDGALPEEYEQYLVDNKVDAKSLQGISQDTLKRYRWTISDLIYVNGLPATYIDVLEILSKGTEVIDDITTNTVTVVEKPEPEEKKLTTQEMFNTMQEQFVVVTNTLNANLAFMKNQEKRIEELESKCDSLVTVIKTTVTALGVVTEGLKNLKEEEKRKLAETTFKNLIAKASHRKESLTGISLAPVPIIREQVEKVAEKQQTEFLIETNTTIEKCEELIESAETVKMLSEVAIGVFCEKAVKSRHVAPKGSESEPQA